MLRRYPIENLLNARDLGGYASCHGGQTQFGRFIRCAITSDLTAPEIAQLIEMGVTDIIDLRSPVEVERHPSAFAGHPDVRYHNISMSVGEDIMGSAKEEWQFGQMYFHMANNPPKMLKVLRALTHAEGIAMFHCTAGKDRTGTTAALLLMLAGVDRDDIVADYMVSGWYVRKLNNLSPAERATVPAHFWLSKTDYILTFFEMFDENFSSIEEYMKSIGLEDWEIEKLRGKLIGE